MAEPQRYFVVGDIHGCPRQLEEILQRAQAFPDHQLVFLGDYIDRGPDSETVLQILRTVDAVFLLGNHERRLIERWTASSPSAALGWLDEAHLSVESFEWLKDVAVDRYETDDYLFVHGDGPVTSKKVVVHGHVPVDKPTKTGHRINLNTRCGAGGPLTALALPEFRYFQSTPSPLPEVKSDPAASNLSALADEGLEEL